MTFAPSQAGHGGHEPSWTRRSPEMKRKRKMKAEQTRTLSAGHVDSVTFDDGGPDVIDATSFLLEYSALPEVVTLIRDESDFHITLNSKIKLVHVQP